MALGKKFLKNFAIACVIFFVTGNSYAQSKTGIEKVGNDLDVLHHAHKVTFSFNNGKLKVDDVGFNQFSFSPRKGSVMLEESPSYVKWFLP